MMTPEPPPLADPHPTDTPPVQPRVMQPASNYFQLAGVLIILSGIACYSTYHSAISYIASAPTPRSSSFLRIYSRVEALTVLLFAAIALFCLAGSLVQVFKGLKARKQASTHQP